jgi:hypothetical protein
LPRAPCSLRLVSLKDWWQRYSRESYRPVHQFIKLIIQRLQIHWVRLATACVGLKECAVTKEFCTYCLPVVSASNLLNQIYNNCKLKISNMPTQNASYTYKINKIHFKSQNSKH